MGNVFDLFTPKELPTPPKPKDEYITMRSPAQDETYPRVVCTCGWDTEQNRNLMELTKEAFDHAQKTGHLLRDHRKRN